MLKKGEDDSASVLSEHRFWTGVNYFKLGNFQVLYHTVDMVYSLGHSYASLLESFDFPVLTRLKLEPIDKTRTERMLAGLLSSRHAEMKFHYGKRSQIYEEMKRESSEIEFLSDRVRNQGNKLFYLDLRFRIMGRDPLELKENASRFESAMNYLGFSNRRFSNINGRNLKKIFSLKRGMDDPYIIDARSVSSILPVYSTAKPENGVLVGIDSVNGKPFLIDSFQNESFNTVILGETGSGKSFFSKVFLRRSIASGNAEKIFIIDPLNEYSASLFGPDSVEINFKKGDILDISGQGPFNQDLVSPLATILSGTIFGDDHMKSEIERDIGYFVHEKPEESSSDIIHRIWMKYGPNNGRSQKFNVISSESWMREHVKVVIFKVNILEEETSESLLPELILSLFAYSVQTPGLKKMLVIEEAHLALSSRYTSGILSNLSRHSRHYMLSIISITQSIDDLFSHRENRSLLANTSSIFVFRTRSMRMEYAKMLNLEGFDEPEFHSLLGGRTVDYSECYFIRRRELFKIRIISTENERKLIK
ncbi:MAG: helicase HerA domain-containing protein [Thermoplasmataceae archaeon]